MGGAQQLGKWGEAQAKVFLEQKGYRIWETNFSVRGGEIDIIGWHQKPLYGNTLCFIEVKTRSGFPGSAERAVGWKKISHMQYAARMFCLQRRISLDVVPIQFEHISIYRYTIHTVEFFHFELPV